MGKEKEAKEKARGESVFQMIRCLAVSSEISHICFRSSVIFALCVSVFFSTCVCVCVCK